MSASFASGNSIWPIAKAAFANVRSASRNCCWRNPEIAERRCCPNRTPRKDTRMKFWASLVGYQLVWFAAVIGAGRGLALAGDRRALLYAACQLGAARRYKTDLSLMAAAMAMGLLLDSGLIHAGLAQLCGAMAVRGDGAGVDSCAMGRLFADLHAILGLSANTPLAGCIAGRRSAVRWLIWVRSAAGMSLAFATPHGEPCCASASVGDWRHRPWRGLPGVG